MFTDRAGECVELVLEAALVQLDLAGGAPEAADLRPRALPVAPLLPPLLLQHLVIVHTAPTLGGGSENQGPGWSSCVTKLARHLELSSLTSVLR